MTRSCEEVDVNMGINVEDEDLINGGIFFLEVAWNSMNIISRFMIEVQTRAKERENFVVYPVEVIIMLFIFCGVFWI